MGFPCSSAGKESTCNAGDPGSTPGRGRSTGEEGIGYPLQYSWASLVAQLVKNPPAMRETWVRSLGWEAMWETWVQFLSWEDPLEKGKATHSSILAWRIPWTVYPWGRKESDTTERLSLSAAEKIKEGKQSRRRRVGRERAPRLTHGSYASLPGLPGSRAALLRSPDALMPGSKDKQADWSCRVTAECSWPCICPLMPALSSCPENKDSAAVWRDRHGIAKA